MDKTINIPIFKSREEMKEADERAKAEEVAKATAAAKEALQVVAAIGVLQRVVPTWPRRERRRLANAFRMGGDGYTKNTGSAR